MSWAGYEGSFEEKNYTKNQIMSEVNEMLEQECSYKMPPHHQSWKFFDEILDSEEDAQEFLYKENLYRKKNRAVRYHLPVKKTKKIKTLEARLEKTVEYREYYKKNHHPSTFKAEFVGCPTCKSKIAKKYIKGYSHSCPVCGGELWSETTQKKIAWYNEKIKELQKQIKQEEKKAAAKSKDLAWYVEAELYIG